MNISDPAVLDTLERAVSEAEEWIERADEDVTLAIVEGWIDAVEAVGDSGPYELFAALVSVIASYVDMFQRHRGIPTSHTLALLMSAALESATPGGVSNNKETRQ